MELYDGELMPLSNNPKLRLAQEKVLRNEELSLGEKMIIGRDHPIKELNGYKLKKDHVYRAVSKELFNIYKQTGVVFGTDENDEYMEYIENGQHFNNNRGVDWYLGGVATKYGDVILECPAYKEYFVPAMDNGCGMSYDPTIRHMKSSGYKKPILMSMITNVLIKENPKEEIQEICERRHIK